VASISCLLQMIWVAGRQRIFRWNRLLAEEEGFHQSPTFYFLQIHAAPSIHSFQTIINKFRSKIYELCMVKFIEIWDWIFKTVINYTCGKHIGIPPRAAFCAFGVVYNQLQREINKIWLFATLQRKIGYNSIFPQCHNLKYI